MSALLQLTNLKRSFGGVRAVDDVSLEIEEGTIFGLIGPNGAGKTTLVNLVTGYIRPQSGSIRLLSSSRRENLPPRRGNLPPPLAGEGRVGVELARRPPHAVAGQGVARTFQTLRLYRNLTAIENVLAGMHLRRRDDTLQQLIPIAPLLREDRRRVHQARELLARVGLAPDAFADSTTVVLVTDNTVVVAGITVGAVRSVADMPTPAATAPTVAPTPPPVKPAAVSPAAVKKS